MPTISIFFGIIVQMNWRDHNPPHVHAWYQGHEALIDIESGEIIVGGLPKFAVGVMREWVRAHRLELRADWEKSRRREPLDLIPGADVE